MILNVFLTPLGGDCLARCVLFPLRDQNKHNGAVSKFGYDSNDHKKKKRSTSKFNKPTCRGRS
jgi:hypothetical protein